MLTHDEMSHSDYVRTHKRLIEDLYLCNLSKHLYEYIQHCSQCQLMQISRHQLYDVMQSILMSSQPFHTITIDFILTLFTTKKEMNCVLSITDKFSKTVTFIPEKTIMTVKD